MMRGYVIARNEVTKASCNSNLILSDQIASPLHGALLWSATAAMTVSNISKLIWDTIKFPGVPFR